VPPGTAAALSEHQVRRLLAGLRRGVPRTEPARMRGLYRGAGAAGPALRQPLVVEDAMGHGGAAVLRTLAARLEIIRELEAALDARLSSTRPSRLCAVCPDSA